MKALPITGVLPAAVLMGLLWTTSTARAEDWPMRGRDKTRNAVSPKKNPPTYWHIQGGAKRVVDDKIVEKHAEDQNVKWRAKLGSLNFSDPVVADGLVWIGTNNSQPRDPAFKKDASVLMCFRESDGKFLYQYVSPRLPNRTHDWPESSLGCSPLVEGDRLWFTSNRCETVCLDIGPLRRGEGQPREVWRIDMIEELGVSPHGAVMGVVTSCSAATYQDLIYVITGNGVDRSHENVPAPKAPSLVCFNKHTGKVVWEDNSPGKNILHGQWASPLVIEINPGAPGQVIAPQGDGWLRSFDARTGKLIWKFDSNPKSAVYKIGGRGDRNFLIATPVLYENRVYIANGRDPEHGEGPGRLWCIDPTKEGDISAELLDDSGKSKPNPNSGGVWCFDKVGDKLGDQMNRTICTVAIHHGLVIAPDLSGYVHCLDARTGKKYWTHDVLSDILGSPLIADGKVYVATADGWVYVFELAKEKKLIGRCDMETAMYSAPVFANGVLYVATRSTLFAIQESPGQK